MAEESYATDFFSSPPQKGPNREYTGRTRAKIRGAYQQGMPKYKIIQRSRLAKSTIYNILAATLLQRTQKWKQYKLYMLSQRTVRQIIRTITSDYTARRLSITKVKSILGLRTSKATIARELKAYGYRRYVACRRPYILRAAGKKRLRLTLDHRW